MIKNKKLLIFGCGETANLAYEYFTHDSDYEVTAFCVQQSFIKEQKFCTLPVLTFENIETLCNPQDYDLFVAMGSGELNRQRSRMCFSAQEKGYNLASYISSRAFVWHNVKIGDNCFILEDNTLQPFVEIGNNVTLWSGNNIAHRSIVRDNCFISCQVAIAGFCEIGESTFMGVNSSVADGIKIGRDNYIAMGAVINKHTTENTIYRGNPAMAASIPAKKFCQVKE